MNEKNSKYYLFESFAAAAVVVVVVAVVVVVFSKTSFINFIYVTGRGIRRRIIRLMEVIISKRI